MPITDSGNNVASFCRNMADKSVESSPTSEQAITPVVERGERSVDKGKGILIEEDVTDVTTMKPEDTTKPSAEQAITPVTEVDQRSTDKGKGILVERDITDVMSLTPDDVTKPLELKVYRKWASRNVPDPNPTGLCFMLLDKQVLHTQLKKKINKHQLHLLHEFHS